MIRARLSRRSHDIDHARSFGGDTAWYILIMQSSTEEDNHSYVVVVNISTKPNERRWIRMGISPRKLVNFSRSKSMQKYLLTIHRSVFICCSSVFGRSLLFGGTSGSLNKSSKWEGLGKLTCSFATAGEEEDSPGKKGSSTLKSKRNWKEKWF